MNLKKIQEHTIVCEVLRKRICSLDSQRRRFFCVSRQPEREVATGFLSKWETIMTATISAAAHYRTLYFSRKPL